MKKYVAIIILGLISILGLLLPTQSITEAAMQGTSAADIAWLLISSGLVLLMTPGLAFFYGGMVNRQNIISTMAQSLVAMGLISVLWIVVGFSLAFGDTIGGFIGNPLAYPFFNNLINAKPFAFAATIPALLYALFQMKFAIITPALILGSFAERIRFSSYVLFITLFIIFVYSPVAHWVWSPNGFLLQMGVLDFAGGTVVHVSSGFAALVASIYLKKRRSYTTEEKPHDPANITYVVLGAGLLWFGWFGFNSGSALSSNAIAVIAFANTNAASAAACIAWIAFDVAFGKKPTALGMCVGAVVGLVAITPAAGYVTLPVSLFIGFIAAIISNLFTNLWSSRTSIDDTLDVFPCHGIGGAVGMLLTGLFATKVVNAGGNDGLFYGNPSLFFKHVEALVIVIVFVVIMTYIVLKVTDRLIPLRVSQADEEQGLDLSQHGETVGRTLSGEIL